MLTGLFNAGQYIKNNSFIDREGSKIPQKNVAGDFAVNQPCHITIVVPKQTIAQYIDEIRGSIENGELRSATGSCVYSENLDDPDHDRIYMRQFYAGRINKETGLPETAEIERINDLQTQIANLENERFDLSYEEFETAYKDEAEDGGESESENEEEEITLNDKDKWEVNVVIKKQNEYFGSYADDDEATKVRDFVKYKTESGVKPENIRDLIKIKKHLDVYEINKNLKIDLQDRIQSIIDRIEKLKKEKDSIIRSLDRKIERVFYIISHDTFLNRITHKPKGGKDYIASEYILGKKIEKKLPHPDCFHSDKSVLIIDEVQKVTMEGGTNYFRLYDTLMINARNRLTGKPRMKIILLTATPIFDNPHEASLIINFMRPRIPFPMGKITLDDYFIHKPELADGRIDKDNATIKNKLCYQYLCSGYISYSQGANPKGFPLRRNIIQLHEMSGHQLTGYLLGLTSDVKKDEADKTEAKTEN